MKKLLLNSLFFIFCALVLVLSVRGLPGNPSPVQLNSKQWEENGPMELSPERGRYSLIYSLVEDHSFTFSTDLARFSAPDVGYVNGKYASLFAPAVSFIAAPGYMIGKLFGVAQVGAFAVIAFFAIINAILIRAIAIRMGARPLAGTLAATAFLFGSPAFAYAVTLYQHHISTFLILLSIYLLVRFNTIRSLIAIWMLCAFSIAVDYPNFFMMLPIGAAALLRTFIFKKGAESISVKVPLLRVLAIFAVIIPMTFFLWFNKMSYGNPLQLSGSLERVMEIKKDNKPVFEIDILKGRLKLENKPQEPLEKTSLGFFQSRNLINGFYTLILSPDRGVIMYTPVMLFGLIGAIMAVRKRRPFAPLLVSILGFNLVLYSMWGDPYGGWAFGARYLIPSYALMAIFLSFVLTRFVKNTVFLLFFFIVLSYSVGVNTLGAVTSNRNPPKVEIANLEKQTHQHEEYTYQRNINLLNLNTSKSYVFEAYAGNYISAWDYYIYITGFIISVAGVLLVMLRASSKPTSYLRRVHEGGSL